MMNDNASQAVCIFFSGLLAGLAIGMLFAPQSGQETREMLMQQAEGLKEKHHTSAHHGTNKEPTEGV
jgi:gas vesicle protein